MKNPALALVASVLLATPALRAQAPAQPSPPEEALPAPALPATPTPVRAFVLDTEAKTLSVVDPMSAQVGGSIPLEGTPAGVLRTKDGARLALWDMGERKLTVRFGWHPKTASTVTLVDPDGPKLVKRTEVGWNLERIVPTADGTRLTVLCSGYKSQKPAETRPREVVSLDTATGEVRGRLALDRAFTASLLSSESDVAVLYSPPETPKDAPPLPGELRLVDIRGPSLLATLKVDGAPTEVLVSPNRKHVYLLEPGKRDKKPEKTVRARLQVFSVDERKHVTNLDVGVEARHTIVDTDGGAVYVLSDGQPSGENKKPQGALHVVRGEELSASVPIGPLPLFIRHAQDGSRLYVVSARTLTIVDPVAWRSLADLPLEQAGAGLGEVSVGNAWNTPDHSPAELGITPDGRRGFVLYNTSSMLLVLDLENQKTVASVTTGRGGKKFAKFLGAAMLSAVASMGGQVPGTYAPAPGHMLLVSTDVFIRKDGMFAYANNTQSNDLTIVNAETAAVIDKVPAGGRELFAFHGDRTLAVIDDTSVHLLDMTANKKAGEVEFGSRLHRIALTPDGRRALALTDLGVHVLDGETGKAVGRITSFKKPTQVVFVGGE